MIKLLDLLIEKYSYEECIYFSWDAASWHASKSLYERVVDLRILPIGRIGNDRQIFAETTISPNGKVREGSRLDAFSLVMTAREGNIAVHRIDLLPGGGDASGRIILKAACDINSDGFADIFWIEAGCCGYIIEYDGASWVRPGRITPM